MLLKTKSPIVSSFLLVKYELKALNVYTANVSFLRGLRPTILILSFEKTVVYIWQEKKAILFKSASLNFRQLCSLNTFQPHEHFRLFLR